MKINKLNIILLFIFFALIIVPKVNAQARIESDNYRIQFPDLNFGAVIPPSGTFNSPAPTTVPKTTPVPSANPFVVVDFKSASIIDSFMSLKYQVTLKNNSSAPTKVNGRINLNDKEYIILDKLTISPQQTQSIGCLDDIGSPTECTPLKKPFIGKLKVKIELANDSGFKQSGEEKTTYVLPISLIFFLLSLTITLLAVRKAITKNKPRVASKMQS